MARITRQARVNELMRLINIGPSLSLIGMAESSGLNAKQCADLRNANEARVRNWLNTWVRPQIEALIPECKPKP